MLQQMLQHLRVVQGDRYKAGVFDDILYHFTCSLVEDNVRHFFANAPPNKNVPMSKR
jgi:hypothetical protein